MISHKRIQVYEHSFLRIGERDFDTKHFIALSKLNALHNYQYFDLKHNGVVFKQFVGVLQVDNLTIEILPKIDRYEPEENKKKWQSVLIEMLHLTKKLKIHEAGQTNVARQSITLLDIYFEWFLSEVQLLIHQGLIKQYYKQTGNVKALKGKLEFAIHIQKNLAHKERFYTTHQVYGKDHLIHQVLGQALDIITNLSKGSYLHAKCKTLKLDFPEVKSINATESTFTKLPRSRKNAPYETAISIARIIILNYAPNISKGTEKMLALLFDMNKLWEEYILIRIKQASKDNNIQVYGQNSKTFWRNVSIHPDIVLLCDKEQFIIDTKWKNIGNNKPSIHDLRQMYVYNEYWKSSKSLLLYPSSNDDFDGYIRFVSLDNTADQHKCGLGKVSIFKDCNTLLNDQIGSKILNWIMNEDKIRV